VAEHDSGLSLLNQLVRGRISRRDALKRGAMIGLGTSALATLAGIAPHAAGAQDATPFPAPSGEVTWGLETIVPDIIPVGGIALAEWQGKEFMYDSLMAWDPNLKVIPALATGFENPDDKTYLFHLRKNVKFHDGTTMTAKDVKYSLDSALNPPAPGVKVPYIANIASVDVVDDLTVKITMSKVDPTLPGVFAWTNYTPIIPEGMLEKIEFQSAGIGTGPFKLVEFNPSDSIVYEAFPDHWNPGVPRLAKLTIKMQPDAPSRVTSLQGGETIGTTLSADQAATFANNPDFTVLSGLTSAPRVIQFSMVKEVPWRTLEVRQAINFAIDRQEIIDKVYGGQAELTGVIPPGFGDWPLSNDELATGYKQDVDKAKGLMAKANMTSGFKVELQSISDPDYTQISEIIKEHLKAINIDVTVQPLEIGTFAKNIGAGTFEWASTGRGMRPDPAGHVVDFRSGTANNKVWFGDGWKNDELDQLYDDGLASLDSAKRHADYKRIQEIILEEVPNLYTVQPKKFQVVSNQLEGMYVYYGNTNPGLRTASLKKS
jgi:peptide/nickel transport system substrate-binding protein